MLAPQEEGARSFHRIGRSELDATTRAMRSDRSKERRAHRGCAHVVAADGGLLRALNGTIVELLRSSTRGWRPKIAIARPSSVSAPGRRRAQPRVIVFLLLLVHASGGPHPAPIGERFLCPLCELGERPSRRYRFTDGNRAVGSTRNTNASHRGYRLEIHSPRRCPASSRLSPHAVACDEPRCATIEGFLTPGGRLPECRLARVAARPTSRL